MPTILVVYGTRPESLKLQKPVEAARQLGLDVRVVFTNQSPDLHVDSILRPDFVVPIGQLPESLLPPALVVVQGDTTTAMRAALEAYRLGIPVFHVEAGIRSGDLANPWPEEGYRQMISRIATYHACPTSRCYGNLEDDGIAQGESRVTGNPIVESVRERVAEGIALPLWRGTAHPKVLVTLHRHETAGSFSPLWQGIFAGLQGTNYDMIWPTHPNKLAMTGAPPWAVSKAVPPLTPLAFAHALNTCDLLITDSGGNQEEANVLGVPVVVTRDVTDRPESLGTGGAILGGRTPETLVPAIQHALAMDRSAIQRDCFGDGHASERIAQWWQEIVSRA